MINTLYFICKYSKCLCFTYGHAIKVKIKSCLLPKSQIFSFKIWIVKLGRTEIGSAYLIHIIFLVYMEDGSVMVTFIPKQS